MHRRITYALTLAAVLSVLSMGCTNPSTQTSPTAQRTPARPKAKAAPQTRTAPAQPAADKQEQAPANKPAAQPAAPPATVDIQQRIKAALELSFSSERAEALIRLAQRDDLSADDQIAIIDAACAVGFSEHIMNVMLALAHNPALQPAARDHMWKKLSCIPFSSHRAQVQKALDATR